MFKVVTQKYAIKTAIYPGSYIHIAPSFYIPEVTYIDSFKKTLKFFEDDKTFDLITKNKNYDEEPLFRFHYADYNKELDEKIEYYDLLISQYAGFVSQCCKSYLKPNGILLANNSHGDASMASIDRTYKFIGALYYSNKQYRITTKNLENYFIPKKKNLEITKEFLEKSQKGVGYTKSASAYLFKKV